MKKCVLCIVLLVVSSVRMVVAMEFETIKIAFVTQDEKVPPALSNLDPFIQRKGLSASEMAIEESNTTGQFTGQKYELIPVLVTETQDVLTIFSETVPADVAYVVTNLPIEKLRKLTHSALAENRLFFDAATTDDVLRNQQCQDNVLHMLPSRAMRADALAQYMMKKRWNEWFLVFGASKADQFYAKAIKRAAKKFGIKIVAEKAWTHTYDARRTAQSDVPVFTQGIDYDVLVVADESGLFGEYLSYRTWEPRPVIGTQGLIATAWHRTHEQWGAVQIQNRFKEMSGRTMQEQDYGAYLAIRAIAEASVRAKSGKFQPVKDFLFSDQFNLQGYKGVALSVRPWNGQLRQPVLLAAARSLVTAAPIEGFLHPESELDTLGYDEPESSCNKQPEVNIVIDELEPTQEKTGNFQILIDFWYRIVALFKQWLAIE